MTGTRKLPDGQITSDFQKSCQAPFAKIFLFSFDPNQFTDSPRPVPTEGRCATSSTWSGMRWTRAAGDGVKKRGHRGEREVSRKTIARGMPGRSGVTVVTNSYACFILHARPRAHCAPGIPCALYSQRGEMILQTSGVSRRENADAHVQISVIARSKATKQSLSPCGRGCPSEARAGEGSLSADANPSSVALLTVFASRHLLPPGEKGGGPPHLIPNLVSPNSAFCVEGCERQYCGGASTWPPSSAAACQPQRGS